MKIAIPTLDGKVDNHFGHCHHYTIYTVEEKQIVSIEELPSPQGCGCKSGIAADLEQMGVEVMLAGSMGDGALNKLQAHNIKVIRGCNGPIDTLIKSYLTGFIFDSGIGCTAHEEGHECGHKEEHECSKH